MSEPKSIVKRSIVSNRLKAHLPGKHADLKVAAKALKLSLELAEKALDGLPVYGPKAAIGAVLRIVEQYEKCTDNTELLRGIESHLNRLRTAVIDPLAQPNAVISPELEAAVNTLVRFLGSITSGWDTKLSQGFLKRFLNAEEYETGLMELSHDIDGALSCFQAASTVRQEIQIEKIRNDLLRNDKDARERDEQLLDAIEEVGEMALAAAGDNIDAIKAMPHAKRASYDSAAHNEIRPCLPGTRVGVLDKIRTFIMKTQENQMSNYLLSGMAGLGKSTIARSICEEVKDGQYADLGASFFFSRRAADSKLRNPETVIPTLAYQLAHYDEGFRGALKEELTKDPMLPTKAIQLQADGLLAKPLSRMSPRQHPVLIVLDAFGEKSRTHDTLILHDIEEDVVKGDIRLYLQTSLRAVPSVLGLDLPDGWATQETETLVEMAGKLFIYAATAVRLLSDRRICDPQSVMQKLLKANIGAASGLHARLDETYITILRAAVPPPPEQNEVVERIRQVLGTIIHLQDTLPIKAIDGLLMKDLGYSRRALNSLHSVVLVPESNGGTPRLYHQSFPDFLLDPQRCLDSQFLIRPKDIHTNLSLQCPKILNQYLRRDMAGIEDLLLPHSEIEEFDRKVAIAVPLQLAYACRFWAEHLANSQRGGPDLMQPFLVFVFQNILHWVECMSLLGFMELAICSTQTALQWTEELEAPAGAVEMLHDTVRFLRAYSEPIGSCAIHVYRTALVFTPSETVLLNNFKYEAKGLRVIRGGAETWPGCLAVWNIPDGVNCITFAPNGVELAVAYGTDNNTVFHICNSITGEITPVFRGHSGMVHSVTLSSDGTRIASGSQDITVRVWDAQSGRLLAVLTGHSGRVYSVAFSPDGTRVASGSQDKTVRVWDAQSGKLLVVLKGHSDWVYSVAFSPDGTRIASGSVDSTVRVWDAQSGKLLAVLTGHSRAVTSVAFSPDGTGIASGSWDTTVRVWDVQSGKLLAVLTGHSGSVFSVAFSPNGTRIASGSGSNYDTVRVWHAQSGKLLAVLTGHFSGVSSVAFSPDGAGIASGSWDYTIRVWDAQLGKKLTVVTGHSGDVSSVAFSPDGTRIASGSQDKTVRVWDAQSGRLLVVLKGHSEWVSSMAFSPDGTRIASGSGDKTVRVWEAQSGKLLAVLKGHSGKVRSVVFSPDGTRIASRSDDKLVRVWDAQSGKQLVVLAGHSDYVYSVAFSPDGTSLITYDGEDQKFFNPGTGILQAASGSALSATLANTLRFNYSTRWIIEQSSRRHVLFIPRTYSVSSSVPNSGITFSPNGGLAAFGTEDGGVVIVRL